MVYPTTKAYKRTVGGSYRPLYRATLCTSFQTGLDPVGVNIPIIEGSVKYDGAADIWASLDLTVPGYLWPVNGRNNDLAPYGNELYIRSGIAYSDALVEWIPLGYFRIKTIGRKGAERGPVSISGQDRMAAIGRAKVIAPIHFRSVVTVGEFVEALVLEVFPEAEISWDDDTDVQAIGRDVTVEDDRLGALRSMAESRGKLMYWSGLGVLTFRTPPDAVQTVATLAGGKGGVILEVDQQISDEDVVNAIVARGDGTGAAAGAYGVAFDNDSLTAYNSKFGPAPDFITSSLITTNAQAVVAAVAELRKRSGVAYSMGFECGPRPELQPYDPVRVEFADRIETHVLSSLEIPLSVGDKMSADCRQQSTVVVGAL